MNENTETQSEEYLFTCKDCGSHELLVVVEYTVTYYYRKVLECTCERSVGLAVERSCHQTTKYVKSGLLDDEHRCEFDPPEKQDVLDEEEGENEIMCRKCLENSQDDEWEIIEGESEVDEDSEEFYVHCNGCDREIEFGYSHPDRVGRIWPAECSDFNPWLTWPDPRYLESWRKKNWLRPVKDK